MKKLIIIGGPGPAAVIAQAIKHAEISGQSEYKFCGFLNDSYKGQEIEGSPVLGGLADIQRFINEDYYFIYTIYKIGGQTDRIKLFQSLNIPTNSLATFIHPSAYVAPNVELGPGSVVLPNVSISGNTKIGTACVFNNNVSIGHDNLIGNHCFFAANSCLGAWLKVEQGSWVGLNATVRGKLTIGQNSAIGIGSVITKDIPSEELWIGSPGKFHKKVNEKISM